MASSAQGAVTGVQLKIAGRVDAVMLLGVARDLVVNRSVHQVFRVAIPILCAAQLVVIYLWRGSRAWWLETTKAILGI
jgi:uncharacterized membrane protein YobD (UPF0266 family)